MEERQVLLTLVGGVTLTRVGDTFEVDNGNDDDFFATSDAVWATRTAFDLAGLNDLFEED